MKTNNTALIEAFNLLVTILADKPTKHLEDLLIITNDNRSDMGEILVGALEYILDDRKTFKEFTDNLSKRDKQ